MLVTFVVSHLFKEYISIPNNKSNKVFAVWFGTSFELSSKFEKITHHRHP